MTRTETAPGNIARMQAEDHLEIQREKLKLDREALALAGKSAKMQKITVISAAIAAIAAVIAASASIANFIFSIVTRVPPP